MYVVTFHLQQSVTNTMEAMGLGEEADDGEWHTAREALADTHVDFGSSHYSMLYEETHALGSECGSGEDEDGEDARGMDVMDAFEDFSMRVCALFCLIM